MRRARSATSSVPGAARRLAAGLGGGFALVVLVTVLRLWLGGIFPNLSPFSLYYPTILAAALLGGWVGGGTALALSLLLSWGVFLPAMAVHGDRWSQRANLIIFFLTGALLAFVGARLSTVLRHYRLANAKLADRELRYRTLFEGVTEGFGLLEGVRDEAGALVDLVLVEANPALLRLFNVDASVIGRRWRELVKNPGRPYLTATERAFKGEAVVFQLETPRRWFEIRINRVGDDQVAQIVVDITERKLAERRQVELFDELNHRVKNNLAMISAMLSMQARASDSAEVRQHLEEAVTRIQTIADVHASLYRSSRKDDVDFSSYLQGLCDRLSQSLVDNQRVRIEVSADPAVMPLDRAVALGLVVNELVTNAAKHAYPDEASGVVKVALRKTAGRLILSVSDTGQGLPEGGEGSGLGMRLVRSLVQQAGGVLQVQQEGGMAFTIELEDQTAATPTETAQTRLL